jgi:hypothetical protein
MLLTDRSGGAGRFGEVLPDVSFSGIGSGRTVLRVSPEGREKPHENIDEFREGGTTLMIL